MSADVLCHNPPIPRKGGVDLWLRPIRVSSKDPAGLSPARAPAGSALLSKQSRTEPQTNIDGEELREKQLPHLALDTLDEVIEKVCNGLNQRR
jgi:hypothetical protein